MIHMWRMRTPVWYVLLIVASNPSDAMARSLRADIGAGGAELSFLSEPEAETQKPVEETSLPRWQEDSTNFDGAWTFTSAECS
jgi:hypothetical protein